MDPCLRVSLPWNSKYGSCLQITYPIYKSFVYFGETPNTRAYSTTDSWEIPRGLKCCGVRICKDHWGIKMCTKLSLHVRPEWYCSALHLRPEWYCATFHFRPEWHCSALHFRPGSGTAGPYIPVQSGTAIPYIFVQIGIVVPYIFIQNGTGLSYIDWIARRLVQSPG